MRNSTSPINYELTSEGGSKTIAITPGAGIQPGKFVISGIDPRIQDMRNYITRFYAHLNIVADPDATGNAVSWDKLYKAVSSVELSSPVMGTVFPHQHTRGAVLGHLIQVIGLGYEYPQGARTQIPASTDTDVTLDLFYAIPLAHECLSDPMETAQWAGFFDGGTLEVRVAPSTVYEGDYAGLVTKTGTLRATCETMPSPRNYIGVPFQWRERQIAGGGTSPVLKNVGGETSLNGVAQGVGLAGLWWLTDATGIGLSGPDGVDNFTAYGMTWRGQKQTQNLDPLFLYNKIAMEKGKTGPTAGTGAIIMNDTAGWPYTMDAGTAGDNRPAANSQAMFLPLIVPGRQLMTSKVQRVLGDLPVDFQVTAAITNPHQFVTWELLEFSANQLSAMAVLGRFGGSPQRKQHGGQATHENQLRYTAIEFES